MRNRPTLLLTLALLAAPVASVQAFDLEQAFRDLKPHQVETRELRVTQNGGVSLNEAIEQVRRKTKGRIISAETRVNKNGREMHHIKVLTKDGKVKTHKIQGRKRGNG